jgi:hypothetical protein
MSIYLVLLPQGACHFDSKRFDDDVAHGYEEILPCGRLEKRALGYFPD